MVRSHLSTDSGTKVRGGGGRASYIIVLGGLHLIPTNRAIGVISEGPSWNYTTVLNILFLAVAVMLVVRFLRTGGPAVLRTMNTPEVEMAQHDHAMAGIDHHTMGHGMGMEGMGHAGHAGDAGDCPRTAHRLLVS